MEDDEPAGRGRATVEAALIEATAGLLGEQGTAVTLRDIEARSGCNKGQIHHYFGGKQALIEAAFRELAEEHYENRKRRAESGRPLALTLGEDATYWQALVRLVLDGDLKTASLEFEEGISVPRVVVDTMTAARGLDEPDLELKAQLCAGMALELGWAAFSPFIELAVGVIDDTEREQIVKRIRTFAAMADR